MYYKIRRNFSVHSPAPFLILIDESDGSSPLSKQLEIDGVRAAEKGDFAQAIDCFTQAIANAPRAASCFNNRAQALRLKGDVDGLLRIY